MMTRSTDSFASWTQENLTAINDPETFPENTYGYGLQDKSTGAIIFCGPYTMAGKAGCMVSGDGGHRFKPLSQIEPPPALMKHGWSEQQMARLPPLGPVETPLATEILLENIDGGTPSGCSNPVGVLSGRQPATFYLC